ncbi:non-functional pseudokinase ZED1-like [Pistacia vera]|uniref:non-functional pseudokinase ZED1-like n=1 Tax=Pistacia vera TaxID=55513 RepID=UPI001263E194|nr:non-functional pseudokinase ZED1-like [Pistacia vera]
MKAFHGFVCRSNKMSSCFPRKDDNNLKNDAMLLKQLIATFNGKCNPIRSFSEKELRKATINYDNQRLIITNKIFYKLYNGFLQDRQIFVMKFEPIIFQEKEEIIQKGINNIVFATQMKHKNFLKLIGCCLETQFPILVFDFVGCTTLADRILSHSQPRLGPLLLKLRLKIAMEIAHAVAYLHLGFPRPIVFGSLAPWNIFLDEEYAVKLFDFSVSEFIPEGKTHLEVHLTKKVWYEYVPPDLLLAIAPNRKFNCNEKVDVYCFGELLFMLLSGLSLKKFLKNKGFQMEDIGPNNLNEIIDPVIVGEGICSIKEQQLLALVRLVSECLCLEPEDMPNMIDVTKQLRKMYKSS